MKQKRSNKSVVPQGRIWWKAMGRHPLNAMIGQVVRRLRRERNWSLRELASEAGLTKSYLCGLEHGEHSPTFEVMLRLEAALRMVPGGLPQLALGMAAKAGGGALKRPLESLRVARCPPGFHSSDTWRHHDW